MRRFVSLSIVVATDAQRTNAVYLPEGQGAVVVFLPALDGAGHSAFLEVYTATPPLPSNSANALLLASATTNWSRINTALGGGSTAYVSVVGKDWPLGGCWVRIYVDAVQDATTFKILQ